MTIRLGHFVPLALGGHYTRALNLGWEVLDNEPGQWALGSPSLSLRLLIWKMKPIDLTTWVIVKSKRL